jgi:hypothetical protein
MNLIRAYSPEETARLKEAVSTLRAADEGEVPYQVWYFDIAALEAFVSNEGANAVGIDDAAWDRITDTQVVLSSRLLAALASFRHYLDTTETRLKRSYGPESDPVATFKKATATEFDGAFAYRFWYKLRNFVQHQAPPIRLADLLLESDALSVTLPSSHLAPALDVARLLAEDAGYWSDSLKKEISARGPRMEIVPLLTPLRAAVQRIHDTTNAAVHVALGPAANTIRDLVAEAVAREVHPVLAEMSEEGTPPKRRLTFIQPPAFLLSLLGVDAFTKRAPPTA